MPTCRWDILIGHWGALGHQGTETRGQRRVKLTHLLMDTQQFLKFTSEFGARDGSRNECASVLSAPEHQ